MGGFKKRIYMHYSRVLSHNMNCSIKDLEKKVTRFEQFKIYTIKINSTAVARNIY